MSVTVSLSTLVIDLAAGFHLHLSLDLALTYLVQAKYNEFFFLLHGRRKVHIWIPTQSIPGDSNVFASRSISLCANTYICRSGKYIGLPKRFNKLLPILKMKKSGVSQGVQYGSVLSLHIDISLGGWYWYYVINDICNHVLCNKYYYM